MACPGHTSIKRHVSEKVVRDRHVRMTSSPGCCARNDFKLLYPRRYDSLPPCASANHHHRVSRTTNTDTVIPYLSADEAGCRARYLYKYMYILGIYEVYRCTSSILVTKKSPIPNDKYLDSYDTGVMFLTQPSQPCTPFLTVRAEI